MRFSGLFADKAVKEELPGQREKDLLCSLLMHGMGVVAQARGFVLKAQDEADIVAGIRERTANSIRLANSDALHLWDFTSKIMHNIDDLLSVCCAACCFQPDKANLMQTALGRCCVSCGRATHEKTRGYDEGDETEDVWSRCVSHAAA